MSIQDLSKIDINQLLKNKTLFGCTIIAIGALLLARSVFVKQSGDLKSLRRELTEEEKLEKHIQSVVEVHAKLGRLEDEFASGADTNTIVRIVTDMLKKHTIELAALVPGILVDKDLYTEFPVKFEFETDFFRLGSLLSDLENNKEILGVRRLSAQLSRSSRTEDQQKKIKVILEVWGFTLKR
ncbi:type 4a pilus biogenesis protein PilO [Candidatus Omnitrophota bacterium]